MADGPSTCCGFKKKSVVMTCIGLCCLSLVIWTVVITANTELETLDGEGNSTNTTNTSITLVQLCTFNSSEPLEQVKLSLVRDNITSITRKNFIHRSQGRMAPLCKCFCRFNITEEQLIEAIKYIKLNQTHPRIAARTTGGGGKRSMNSAGGGGRSKSLAATAPDRDGEGTAGLVT